MEEVKDIMLDNLNKADERAGKLEDLEDRADELLEKVRWIHTTLLMLLCVCLCVCL